MKYEILDENGNVINTILATFEFVEETYPGRYREIIQEPIKITIITKLNFLNRFTDEELAAILDAAKSSSLIAVWIKKLDLAENVDLTHEQITNGVNGLELMGLISSGRAAEILN